MTDRRKLLVRDLGLTGVASLIFTLLLALVVPWVPLLLAMPINGLAIKIGSWIDFVLPSQGGWLAGMADYVLGIHILACFEIWIALFVIVRLFRMQSNRREKHDAENSVSLHLNLK